MSTVANLPMELCAGDQMTQEEFHRLYEQTPPEFRAELIGGIVYVASPLRLEHGVNHIPLTTIVSIYQGHTPGVQAADNTTVILGDEGEPQPDVLLRILPEWGGQSQTTADHYVKGAPEFVAEIAVSSRSIDLHAKKKDYARYGVLEYLVVCPLEQRLRWFDLQAGAELFAGADRIIRVRAFPGFWIDVDGVLAVDCKRYLPALEKGLASAEHADFVQRLQDRRSAAARDQP